MATTTAAVPAKRRQVRIPITYVVTLVPVAAALNIIGGYIANALKLPVYLDMIGTAVASIVLGTLVGRIGRCDHECCRFVHHWPHGSPICRLQCDRRFGMGLLPPMGMVKEELVILCHEPGRCLSCFSGCRSHLCIRFRWRNRRFL